MGTGCRRAIVIVAIAGLLVLCLAVAITYVMVGPSVQCILPEGGQAEEGWSARDLVSDGLERCYVLYTPPGYDPAQPTPLVVSFHGFMSNPESHALITHWHRLARDEGFLLVYPQGTHFPIRWNSGPGWVSDADDEQYFLDVLDDVSAVANVDPSRIYVNGFSNGGGMTEYLGCRHADRIAAMGTVAGAVETTEDCHPSRSVPAIVFHGTADPVVLYAGGEVQHAVLGWIADLIGSPGVFIGAHWVPQWAEADGCDPTPQALEPVGKVEGVSYTGCDDGAGVIFYSVGDGGHTWPGGMPIPAGVGETNKDVDATEEMWRFFQRYTLDE